MENTHSISRNEDLFNIDKSLICYNCNSQSLKRIISKTNSTYEYCTNCNYEKENAFKHTAFDLILSTIKNSFEMSNYKLLNSLKIEIIKRGNSLNLLINNIHLSSVDFKYNFSTNDIYFLENTIYDLLEDFYPVRSKIVDVLICE